MERLKNMELKKTFLVLSASCVLVALLMLGLVFIPNGQLPVDGRLPDKSAFAYSLMRHLNTFDTMYVSAGS